MIEAQKLGNGVRHKYNVALAGKRADAVKQAIVAESMLDGGFATTSRVAMDAKGTDEAAGN
jgi:outer membrane protein OmpA-like peptidoglycan-associated protein